MIEKRQIARERRHTLYFLRYAREISPVFIDTDVDMEAVLTHRSRLPASRHYSIITYIIFAAGRVLVNHPEANSAVGAGLVPALVRFPSVDVKIALDKTLNGQRIVASGLIRGTEKADLVSIQQEIDRYKTASLEELAEMRGMLMLHRLPVWLGWLGFSATVRRLFSRSKYMGTVAISSLGHRAVNGFYAVGGTTITLNLGQIREMPVVKNGAVTIGQMLRINMTFDHRAIDGAMAADILSEIKGFLEKGGVNFSE